jgi:carbon monoxide dehydrogenase subunit G
MISGTHTVEIATPPDRLWDYLANFDNWAQFVVGFQNFRIVDERTSVWTLRGDVGVLAREVELEVTLLSEEPGRRATYSITGITERIDGTGTFEIAPRDQPPTSGPGLGTAQLGTGASGAPEGSTWWRRLVRRWVLALIRRQRAKDERKRSGEVAATAPTAGEHDVPAGQGPGSVLTFTLAVTPGGAMAPVVEMLMRPLLEPSAEDFSLRIREQLEGSAHA